MPITYEIDKTLGMIFATASGELTEDELLEHKKKIFADPRYRPGMVELSDVRHISKLSVTPEGIQRFVAQDAKDWASNDEYKLAIVVGEDLAFGMGRMYEMSTSERFSRVRIFRDLDQARVWLGLRDEVPK